MVEAKEVIGVSGGIGIGAVDTYLLRKYADTKYGVKKLKRFGQPSVLVNLVTGIPTLALGVAGMFDKGPVKDSDSLKMAVGSYGVTAIAGAVFGMVSPIEDAYSMVPVSAKRVGIPAHERVTLKPTHIPVPGEMVVAREPVVAAVVPSVEEQFM